MVVRTRLPVAACLCWLTIVLSAGPLLAQPNPQQPEEPNAKQKDQASDQDESSPTDRLALEEQRIAERFQHLQQVLLRMAELTAATDPRRAALLKKAFQQSEEQFINKQFEMLVSTLKKDRLADAVERQTDLDRDLRALLKLLLSENRARRIEAEKARIRRYLKILNRIIKQQKDVQGRTAGGGNPKGLSGEQGRLAKKTGELAKDIKQNEEEEGEGKGKGEGEGQGQGQGQGEQQEQGQNPVRKRLEAAQQRMKEAQEKLDKTQREGAVDKQEEAIRELEQAKAELEEILRQLREEEIERILAMLEARFHKMLQLQRVVYEGTVRLDKVPKPQRSHSHEIEARRLSSKETKILVEADKALLLLREDGTAVAFPEAVEQMREDMQQVVLRLARAKVGQITQAIEEDIIAALEEMIEALKKAQKDMKGKKPCPCACKCKPPLIDTLAELKMIRALQMRVNRRTQRYSKLIEGEQAESAELIDALQRLAEREQRIHRVTQDLEMGRNK